MWLGAEWRGHGRANPPAPPSPPHPCWLLADKLEQNSALRRCPPPPSCQPLARQPARARAKNVSCHTPSCHPPSSGDELRGSAELPQRRCTSPARHSTARLARSCTQPSRELCYSTPLPQPFCEPVRLFCGCEPEELLKDPAEELPKELCSV